MRACSVAKSPQLFSATCLAIENVAVIFSLTEHASSPCFRPPLPLTVMKRLTERRRRRPRKVGAMAKASLAYRIEQLQMGVPRFKTMAK